MIPRDEASLAAYTEWHDHVMRLPAVVRTLPETRGSGTLETASDLHALIERRRRLQSSTGEETAGGADGADSDDGAPLLPLARPHAILHAEGD